MKHFLRKSFQISTTVACEDNLDFRIGMDTSIDESNAESQFKSDDSDFDSSFERELERERMFCEGSVLIEQITDIKGAEITEMMTDENGQSYFRNI